MDARERAVRTLVPKVGVVALCSPLEVGADQAPAAVRALAQGVRELGCEVVDAGVPDGPDGAAAAGRRFAEAHVDAIACVATSWYEDYLALDLLEECPVPLFLWSLPGMETGALCGTQQLTCFLKQLERPYACAFGPLDDAGCRERARSFLRAAALHRRLRRARIGLAGQRIGGMTHTSPNEFLLKKAIGPRVVPLDLPALLQRSGDMPADAARALWESLKGRAGACRVADADGIDSMQVYGAVRELVEEHRLDALTIGCYPHLMGRVCLAASLLADDGVPLACEGDVHGSVAQLMLALLTGMPTHNTDWLNPLADGSVVFTHCGSGSLSLAQERSGVTLGGVRLMHQGVCALFTARPGPVTLISLLARPDGYQCALLEGEALPTEMVFPGNPLRVRFPQSVGELIDWIHAEGIGHHWMAGYGHVGEAVRAWARCAGPSVSFVEA